MERRRVARPSQKQSTSPIIIDSCEHFLSSLDGFQKFGIVFIAKPMIAMKVKNMKMTLHLHDDLHD